MESTLFSVENKTVIVTGGLGQLGHQFTLALLDHEARVVIFDISADEQMITNRFGDRAIDANLMVISVDITNRKSLEEGLRQVNDKWGPPDALINNAALDSSPDAPADENGPFEQYPESSWDNVMDVNVKGTFLCCQVVGDSMAKAGRGSIINISSIYGLVSPDQTLYEYRRESGVPFFKPVAYSVSKSALLNLTRYLATYWAGRNVRVNTVTFAGVFNNQDEQFLKKYCARMPMGRMANEDEYNGAIIFLISNASSYMTGSNLIIDGGWTAW